MPYSACEQKTISVSYHLIQVHFLINSCKLHNRNCAIFAPFRQ